MTGPANSGGAAKPARTIYLIAGEHSGDALGAKLIDAIEAARPGEFRFSGVGGAEMHGHGLASLFPIEDVAVMGPLSILPSLPRIVRRVYQTVDAALAAKPDAVVIIDSPEFTHPIAKRIRKRAPHIPIIDYVSPSVWAWRSGRAKTMRSYIDEVLALLPFEPEAHQRLGGPHCTYVGHPLIERLDDIRNADAAALARRLNLDPSKPVLLVLPGSRKSEVGRLIGDFGDAVGVLTARGEKLSVIIPTVGHVRELIDNKVGSWTVTPHIVDGAADKYAAMRLARAAVAASGTVTLELGLAGVPAVVSYKVDAVMLMLRSMLKTPSIVLTNLVAGEMIYPERLQEDCTGEKLADALQPLLGESAAREKQITALARIPALMQLPQGTPSQAAAAAVLAVLDRHADGKSRRGAPI
jgi:lipid-A-disaccharide synthase